ncbi:MAG: integral rane protein [Dactylosporangium sp.]|jgi:hypothetical protein|nr:integral rane protein [Dactylosporangium sp.]
MPMSHSGWAEWRRFSAAMLALVGAFNVVEGLVAIYDGNLVRVDPSRVLLLDLAGWAQVTLTLGALLLALGIWLSMVTVRVRLVALSVVLVHALTQLGVLAAFPAWALLMISCDVVIIFALTATPAGAAASVARGATVNVGTGDVREAVTGVPTRTGAATHGPAIAVGGGRSGYVAGDRIRYRPRHQVAGAAATVVLGPPLTDAITAGTTPDEAATTSHETAAVAAGPAPRALPPAPPAAAKAAPVPEPATSQPATATMVGAIARTAAGTGAATATGKARGVAAPIIGAISGRWPDASLQ